MRTSKIYQVRIDFSHPQFYFRGSLPHVSFYSNLSKTVEALQSALVLYGWELSELNYSAVYRSVRLKGRYVKYIKKNQTPFFKIEIIENLLNPKLNTFDLERAPD